MKRVKGYEKTKARAAGMAAATRGRSRRFADKADLLDKQADDDADAEIESGVEEWREGQVKPQPAR